MKLNWNFQRGDKGEGFKVKKNVHGEGVDILWNHARKYTPHSLSLYLDV